jgi:hypothetical protein
MADGIYVVMDPIFLSGYHASIEEAAQAENFEMLQVGLWKATSILTGSTDQLFTWPASEMPQQQLWWQHRLLESSQVLEQL